MTNEQNSDAVWLPEDFEPIPFDCWDEDETLLEQAAAIACLVWPNIR